MAADEINPNVNVGETSTQVTVETGGSVSFDDLMKLEQPKAAEPKEEPAPKEVKATEKVPDASKDEPVVKKEEKVEAKEQAAALKMLKAKLGDQEIELAADAMLEHMVDKQPVQVSVQDLLNNYSGKVAWDKKFTELDRERRSYKSKVESDTTRMKNFFQAAKDGNINGALGSLAESAGIDPIEFMREFRAKLIPDAEKWMKMSPEERKIAEQNEQISYLTDKDKRKSEDEAQRKQRDELSAEVEKIQKEFNLDSEKMIEIVDEIVATGKVTEEQITPKMIADYHQITEGFRRVDNVLDKIDPELKHDDEVFKQMARVLKDNPDFSDEDLEEIAREAFEDSVKKRVSKSLSKKVEASKSNNTPTPKSSGTKNFNSDPISFDDLD